MVFEGISQAIIQPQQKPQQKPQQILIDNKQQEQKGPLADTFQAIGDAWETGDYGSAYKAIAANLKEGRNVLEELISQLSGQKIQDLSSISAKEAFDTLPEDKKDEVLRRAGSLLRIQIEIERLEESTRSASSQQGFKKGDLHRNEDGWWVYEPKMYKDVNSSPSDLQSYKARLRDDLEAQNKAIVSIEKVMKGNDGDPKEAFTVLFKTLYPYSQGLLLKDLALVKTIRTEDTLEMAQEAFSQLTKSEQKKLVTLYLNNIRGQRDGTLHTLENYSSLGKRESRPSQTTPAGGSSIHILEEDDFGDLFQNKNPLVFDGDGHPLGYKAENNRVVEFTILEPGSLKLVPLDMPGIKGDKLVDAVIAINMAAMAIGESLKADLKESANLASETPSNNGSSSSSKYDRAVRALEKAYQAAIESLSEDDNRAALNTELFNSPSGGSISDLIKQGLTLSDIHARIHSSFVESVIK